jgi:hypothetical protein
MEPVFHYSLLLLFDKKTQTSGIIVCVCVRATSILITYVTLIVQAKAESWEHNTMAWGIWQSWNSVQGE